MKTIIVTRTFEPVTRTVQNCHECPYYKSNNDGQMTLVFCEHPKFTNKGAVNATSDSPYDKLIEDVDPHPYRIEHPKISKHCPIIKEL